MRRTLILTLAVFAFTVLTVIAADTVSVIVKKTSIRKDAQFYSPAVAEALYKDELIVLSKEKDWLRVRRTEQEGWIHISAVSSLAGTASSNNGNVSSSYSSDEIALAGKGFSEQVEGRYRQDNPDLNFAAVDTMESYSVPVSQILAFQTEGKLVAKEITP